MNKGVCWATVHGVAKQLNMTEPHTPCVLTEHSALYQSVPCSGVFLASQLPLGESWW